MRNPFKGNKSAKDKPKDEEKKKDDVTAPVEGEKKVEPLIDPPAHEVKHEEAARKRSIQNKHS